MKGIATYLMFTVLLTAGGAICLMVGLLERRLTAAEERIIAMDYDAPRAALQEAERYLEYASLIPAVGNAPVNNVRARQAALRYWKQEFSAILPEQVEPVAGVAPDNVALQFVVANAVYREASGRATGRADMLQALNRGINAYATVLRNAERHEEAAYNYEYVVRLRDELLRGRRMSAPPEQALLGRQGKALERGDTTPFKIYVPYESDERGESGDAAKSPPPARKG